MQNRSKIDLNESAESAASPGDAHQFEIDPSDDTAEVAIDFTEQKERVRMAD